MLKAANNVLTNYVYVKFKQVNPKLANQSMLDGILVIEMVNASKKAGKILFVWESVERSNKKKLRYGQWKIYLH